MKKSVQSAGSLAVALLVMMMGCDAHPGAPSVSGSLEEATVKGTVRVRGKLVGNGTIIFKSANIRRPKSPPHEAPIGKDGTYAIQTLVGQNYVEVSCQELHTPQNRRLLENETGLIIGSGESTVDINLPTTPR